MATETQDYTGVGGQGPTPAKFSRYRSVRKAASTNAQGMAPLNTAIPPAPTRPSAWASASQAKMEFASCQPTTIKKSMSRYRRQKPSMSHLADAPPLPMTTERYAVSQTQPATTAHDEYAPRRPSTEDSHSVDATKPRRRFMGAMQLDTHGKGLFGGNGNTSSDTEQDERERDRRAAMASLTGETPAAPSGYQRPATRGRAATDREVPRVTDKRYKIDSDEGRRHSLNEPKRKSFKDAMKLPRAKERKRDGLSVDAGAETNAPTLFPGIDAPVSAVNAGERKVLVQYKKECLKLSVSPSTSAYDLLVSASRKILEIDPPRFILMESFTAQGLERPLRQYECIRDVMNSWANDTENTLIVVPAPSVYALDFLAAPNVPTNPPMDATFLIYYSQKPRKWEKRYLTIRSDGQIVLSKKEMTKEQTNVCHLSDFDIYSPTPSFLSQRVKPPKKICYAIKSQQKASMFLTTENFIHFFATNDKSVADGWYRAVQIWRSWYLVNKLGAGQAEDEPVPVESVQPRSFKPLLASIDTSIEEEGSASTERPQARQTSARRGSSREHGPPPSSFPKSLAALPDPEPATTQLPEESPFSAGGLLGRTYTLRQKAMKDREDREKREAEVLFNQGLVGSATTAGPAAVPRQTRSGPASRTNSITSAHHQPDLDNLLKRSHSIKQGAGPQGKPLVDLTPVYQEPPQHTRKGRGVAVDTGGPLIDAATSLSNELAGSIAIPPAKTWRRPTLTGPGPTLPTPSPEPQSGTGEVRTRNRSNTARSRHHKSTSPVSPASPPDVVSPLQEQAFVPNSLLARTGTMTAATGVPIGHGVATGDRNATKPMLDVTPQSPFAEGSLLRGL